MEGAKSLLNASEFVKQALGDFPVEFTDISGEQKDRIAILCSAKYEGLWLNLAR